jgi:DNA-binding LacI/PurR family transcriptional regulator
MKKAQVTITDIARELNISASTVSRALHNHHAICEETKRAVMEVAQRWNYQPNMQALNLLKRKTNIIGIVVPEITSHFFSTAISGVQDIVTSHGYNLMISQSNESFEDEIKTLNTLFLSRIDGFLISPASGTFQFDHINKLKNSGIPLVIFDRDCEGLEADKVLVDDYDGAFQAVDYLVKTGCQRIAHIAGPANLSTSSHRLNGYLDALKKHNRDIDEELIIEVGGFSPEFGVEAATKLVNLPNPPDAIFGVNDGVAIGAMYVIKEAGFVIPDQISIIGFDDEPYSSYFMPSLTSVWQPVLEMGMLSARILLKNMTTEAKMAKEVYRHEILKPELVVRNSSKKLY